MRLIACAVSSCASITASPPSGRVSGWGHRRLEMAAPASLLASGIRAVGQGSALDFQSAMLSKNCGRFWPPWGSRRDVPGCADASISGAVRQCPCSSAGRLSNSSIAAAAAAPLPGMRWLYVSIVSFVVVCPRRSESTFGCNPAATPSDVDVWRSVCGVMFFVRSDGQRSLAVSAWP